MNKKLTKLAAVPAVVGALLVVTVLAFQAVRHLVIQDQQVLAQSVAQSLLPVLLVNDTQNAQALVKALGNYPGVASAELISAEGSSLVSYAKVGPSFVPAAQRFELAFAQDDPNQVRLMVPITFDSMVIANLHIAVNLWPIYLRIITWLGVFLMVPSVLYVVMKQQRFRLRYEQISKGGGSGQGGRPFDAQQALAAEMRDAGISLDYQPIQRFKDGGVFGMAVMVCWQQPSGQTVHVSPSAFVNLAEKSGICLPFDDWLLTTACAQASRWQAQYGPLILTLDINAAQFKDASFAQKIRAICDQTQYPHRMLALVVHESVVSPPSLPTLTRVRALTGQGFSVTVQGFGLLPGSLDVLAALPVSQIKLDPKLIKRVGHDEQLDQLIQTISDKALSHDVQVMADGVECGEQHTALARMGCVLGQGAYFQHALSACDFEAFLKERLLTKASMSSVGAGAGDGVTC